MSQTDDEKLLAKAKADYKLAKEWWDPNCKAWIEDAKFRGLDQWPANIKKLRSQPGQEKPCLVVDKLNQYVRQVVNDWRQNRPSVKVLPVEAGDKEVAEGLQGLIRNIWNVSRADQALDTAMDHAVGCGFGFVRVLTDYAGPNTFNHEIIIKRVPEPTAVKLDPHIQEADGSDARFGFVEEDIPKDDYLKRHPKAKHVDWESDSAKWEGWSEGKTVRVCEYWYKVEEPTNLLLLEDGTTVTEDDYWKAPEPRQPIQKSRTVNVAKVKWCRMSGAEILEKADWPGQYIPIVPVFGNEQIIEGKTTYSGLIRAGKDAQILYNFSRSAFAERVAMTPKAPWIIAEESVDDHPEWENPNGNHQALKYRAFNEAGTPIPPPQRINPTDVPGGFMQDMELAEHDIQGALGMYNASLGEKSNEKSGKAILARQREGDTGTFHYQDNGNRAVGYLGRILVDLIPKVWDSKRAIRLLGEDGSAVPAMVDPEMQAPMQKQRVDGQAIKIFNFGIGRYDTVVSTGPSYTTKRQEAAEAQMQLAQAVPQLWEMGGDIIVRNLDWPGADDLANRWKKMLPPGIADDEGDDSPEVQAVKQQAKQLLDQAQQQIQAAEQGIQERDEALKAAEAKAQALQADREVEMRRLQLEEQKLMLEASKPEPQVEDTSEIERLKLEYEDRWKKLEAETKVIVAEIAARQATDTASIGAEASAMASQRPQEGSGEPQESKTDSALAVALQGFQAALMELRKPRQIIRDAEGRAQGIQ